MPDVKRQNTCNRDKNLAPKGIQKELWHQSPALATLIYVDWLPTGQWSAVSSDCLRAWITAFAVPTKFDRR